MSGFLITSLLDEQWRSTGTISFRAFYVRRALRLFPALLTLLGVLQLYALTFVWPPLVTALRHATIVALLYVTNWAQAFGFMGPLGLLSHTWSLAIEEQFYVLWPIAFLFLLRRFRGGAIIAILLTTAVASTLWRAHLWLGPASFPRVHYGFDTHADGLLVGCALALCLARGGGVLPARIAMLPRYLAIPAGVVILACMHRVSLHSSMYPGGLTVIAIATAVILAEVRLAPAGSLARALAFAPLVAIGRISYGLYLWHWPVLLALRPEITGFGWGANLALQLLTVFLIAALSFVVIERFFLNRKDQWAQPSTNRRKHPCPTASNA